MSFVDQETDLPVLPEPVPGGPVLAGPDLAGPETAEPGTAENPLRITDPLAMRALAHPARIAILQHLVIDGPATATACAEVAGLSPSACSYHLRALARYGFVAEDLANAADGRHRPWRARVVAISFGEDPDQPEAVQTAGRLLAASMQARIGEVRARYLEREADYPPEWRDASGMHQDVLHVTAEELTAVRTKFVELLADYRRLNRADRPPGTRRVHAVLDLVPWFDPEDD